MAVDRPKDKIVKALELVLEQAKAGLINKVKIIYDDQYGSTIKIEEPGEHSQLPQWSNFHHSLRTDRLKNNPL